MLPSPTVSVLLPRARMAHDITHRLALDMAECTASSFSRSTWAVRSRTRKDVSRVRSYAPLGHRAPPSRAVSEPRPPSSRESSCNAFHAGLHHNALLFEQQTNGFRAHAMARVVGYGCSAAAQLSLGPIMCGRRCQNRLPLPCRSSTGAPDWSPSGSPCPAWFALTTFPSQRTFGCSSVEQVIHQVPSMRACSSSCVQTCCVGATRCAGQKHTACSALTTSGSAAVAASARLGCGVVAGVLRHRVHSEMVASSAPRVELAGVLCVPYPSPCLRRSSAAAFALIVNIRRGGFGLFARPRPGFPPSGMLFIRVLVATGAPPAGRTARLHAARPLSHSGIAIPLTLGLIW